MLVIHTYTNIAIRLQTGIPPCYDVNITCCLSETPWDQRYAAGLSDVVASMSSCEVIVRHIRLQMGRSFASVRLSTERD